MDRSKLVAIITGAIALALSIAYLLVVQFLDSRGEMIPAPISATEPTTVIAQSAFDPLPSAVGDRYPSLNA